MDLVEQAGVDVSDWANMKNGEVWAARTAKINCYEWSFVQPNEVVVSNFWFDEVSNRGHSDRRQPQRGFGTVQLTYPAGTGTSHG